MLLDRLATTRRSEGNGYDGGAVGFGLAGQKITSWGSNWSIRRRHPDFGTRWTFQGKEILWRDQIQEMDGLMKVEYTLVLQ